MSTIKKKLEKLFCVLEMKRLLFTVSCLVLFHFKFRLVQKMQTWKIVAAVRGPKTIFVPPAKISLKGL